MIDLHVHTCYSDGEYTPSEIIEIAKGNGLEAIAITDHDSVNGIDEAITGGKKNGIYVIPGIEITAFDDTEIHVLGYNIDFRSDDIKKYVKDVEIKRQEEINKIFEFLDDAGIKLSKDDVDRQKDGEIVTIWHFSKAIAEKGYTDNAKDALERFFRKTSLNEINSERITVKDAIELINKVGGVSVLAHPGRVRITFEELIKKIYYWKTVGLNGIEAIYSLNSDEENEKFLGIAKEFGLDITIGSDYHGEHVKPNISMGSGVNGGMLRYKDISLNDIGFLNR